jgi:conjugal transfer/entry exclusion protein
MNINCTSTSTPAILADIAKFRDKLSKLEALVARRDEIKSQIADIDLTLRSVLGDEFMATQERLVKSKSNRQRNTEPMADRLKAVCDLYPQGATVKNFVDHMQVKKVTAVTYLYSTHKDLVSRAYNAEGKAIWTMKN